VSKGETFLIRRTSGEKPAELIRVPDELVVLAGQQRRAAEDVAIQPTARDFLFVLFRHLPKSIIFFCTVFGLALLVAMFMPNSYQSSAALLVRLGAESMLPDPSVQIGKAVVAPIQSRLAEINTELQILRSREVAEVVIGKLGAARILNAAPASSAAIDRDAPETRAAILQIDRKLQVEVEPDSNVLKITYEAKDPLVARDVVAAYTDAFKSVRAKVYRNAATAAFFGGQEESVRKAIEGLEREIKTLKDATGVADLEEQRRVLISRAAGIQSEIDALRRQLAAINAMPSHPGQQRLQTLLLQQNEASDAIRRLNDVTGKLQQLEREHGVKSDTFKQYAAIAQQAEVEQNMADGSLSNISTVQAASTPLKPSKPNRLLILGVGLFLALSGGLGLAFVAEAIDHSIKRPEDLAMLGIRRTVSVPLIAALRKAAPKSEPLPTTKAAEVVMQTREGFSAGPWTAPGGGNGVDSLNVLAQAPVVSWFHDLRQGVRRLAEQVLTGTAIDGSTPRVIAFIGGRPGEGASTIAAATAALLAERAQLDSPAADSRTFGEVLLIDADLHAPTLHRQLGVELSPGLTDWLSDPTSIQTPLEATIKAAPVDGLHVMPAGALRGGALTPNRLKRLIDVVAPNYQFVVIDLPSVDEAPEAARLAAVCDGSVWVVQAEVLRKQAAIGLLTTLQEAGVHVLGAVLNQRTYPVPEWLYERV